MGTGSDREDAGRALVQALNAGQQDRAIIDVEAPRDILTGAETVVGPLDPVGIEARELTSEQSGMLIDVYILYIWKRTSQARQICFWIPCC